MEQIPLSVLTEQLSKLSMSDLLRLCLSNKYVSQLCQNDLLWQHKFKRAFGDVNLFGRQNLSYQKLYQEIISGDLNVIEYRVTINDQEEIKRILLSHEGLNGLIAFLTLYFEALKKTNKNFYAEEDIFEFKLIESPEAKEKNRKQFQEQRKLNLKQYDDYLSSLRHDEPPLPKTMFGIFDDNNTDGSGYMGTVGEYYADASIEFELASSFTTNSDPLPPYEGEIYDYLQLLNEEFDENDIKQYIVILATPNREHWLAVTFDDLDFLEGIKLGCTILKLDCKKYIVSIFT